MGRRRFSEREIIGTLAWQGAVVNCHRCKGPLCFVTDDGLGLCWPQGNDIEREHLHELKLGGPDLPHNCRYSHRACHAIVTNGTPATTAGSSKQRIAKTRGNRAAKFAVHKLRLDKKREPRPRYGNTTFRSTPR